MNRQDEPAPDGESTVELREEIEQTRDEMGATLDAIQERLSPETLKDQAKDVVQEAAEQAKEVVQQAVREAGEQAREVVREATTQAKGAVHDATIGKAEEAVGGATRTARGWGTTMLETIKQNPVPAALAGIGIGWLFMKRRSTGAADDGRIGYAGAAHGPLGYAGTDQVVASADATGGRPITDTVGTAAGQTLEKAGGAVDQVRGVTGEVVTQAQEAAGRVAGAVQDRTGRVAGGTSGQVQRLLDESPLVLGGIALAVGAAVGLLLPATQQEDQLLGQARDSLLQQAKETAQDVQPKVQRVVEEAQRAVQEEAKEQQLTG